MQHKSNGKQVLLFHFSISRINFIGETILVDLFDKTFAIHLGI